MQIMMCGICANKNKASKVITNDVIIYPWAYVYIFMYNSHSSIMIFPAFDKTYNKKSSAQSQGIMRTLLI